MSADTETQVEHRKPAFRVLSGNPDEEDIAAIAVVFAAMAGPEARADTGTQPRKSAYNAYWRAIRRTFFTGRETWNSGIRQF